ncbi:MAG: hypothetical protein JSU63_18295 [Phycisphaerales bacterium]|nr:MAG: hypothetical protein JSU63_18295 [Phycisphaerales bacterium]
MPRQQCGIEYRTVFLTATACALFLTTSIRCKCEKEQPPSAEQPDAPALLPTEMPAALEGPIEPSDCMASECHAKMLQVSYRHQPLQANACDVCHQPEQPDHKFPLKRTGREMCEFCHPVAGHKQRLHKVIADEGCLPCHNPHGSDTKFLLTGASAEFVCQRCHKIPRQAHKHHPFATGQCTVCHQPHESDNRFLLFGGEGNDHCFVCHTAIQTELAAAGVPHKAIEKDGCVGCHDPHSSDYPAVLVAAGNELCFKCHAEIGSLLAETKWLHGAVSTGDKCANCHDPHAGNRAVLLRGELRLLCLGCHSNELEAQDGRKIPDMRPALLESRFLHGPVRMGNCNACHHMHASNYVALLRKHFPPEFYEDFDLASYALCFECHNSALVLAKEGTALTGFRNGQRNLHHVHINRAEKGRTCRTCHEMHGSNQLGHTASTVPFEGGSWQMPINFEPIEGGGRCSPGCHDTAEYRR